MTFHNTLTASVNYIPGTGRFQYATVITINLGSEMVATRTLGGRYSQAQAMAEFKKNPKAFVRGGAFDAARQLKLVA